MSSVNPLKFTTEYCNTYKIKYMVFKVISTGNNSSHFPPLVTHCKNTYPLYLEGGRGGGEPMRRLEGHYSKEGSKIPT
jgi:hypothetical protein